MIIKSVFWPHKGEKEQGVTLFREVKRTYYFYQNILNKGNYKCNICNIYIFTMLHFSYWQRFVGKHCTFQQNSSNELL